MKTILVTGSSGLIGSEAVQYFDAQGHRVIGVDNNMRQLFFGAQGDTTWNLERLKRSTKQFQHASIDIRDRNALDNLFEGNRFDLIVHCAAQPSHDKARDIPILDFEVNALGTINLLEATRQHCPEAVFLFLSTNKVYGDSPNEIPLQELPTRWDYARKEDFNGIDETCRIDRTLHSLFGASKAAADLVAQEYGRYFKMNVGVFRGGCFFAAAAAEFDGRPGPVRDRVAEIMKEWLATLQRAVIDAQQARQLATDIDPAQLAFEINALEMGANWAFQLHGDKQAFKRARDSILERLRRGSTELGSTLLPSLDTDVRPSWAAVPPTQVPDVAMGCSNSSA